jgi:uncharacterized protein with PQ loop repeat
MTIQDEVRGALQQIPLIAANGVTLVLASIILYFNIKNGSTRPD